MTSSSSRNYDDCTPCELVDPRNPARFSSGQTAVIGGGLPLFNAEDGAIGSSPSKANFLSSLQRTLQDKGFAPAGIYGFKNDAPQPWYRPELAPDALKASWNDYLAGVNMGTYRGGILGVLLGGSAMLALLYFSGAMVKSPKPSAPAPRPAVALSRHRSKGHSR